MAGEPQGVATIQDRTHTVSGDATLSIRCIALALQYAGQIGEKFLVGHLRCLLQQQGECATDDHPQSNQSHAIVIEYQ